MKTVYLKTAPRRRSKYFADGSALVAVSEGGTVLIEIQTQYKVVDLQFKPAKPRHRHRSYALAAPTSEL
jgi:hypothetical protein